MGNKCCQYSEREESADSNSVKGENKILPIQIDSLNKQLSQHNVDDEVYDYDCSQNSKSNY